MAKRSTMEEKRTGAMKVGAGVLIAFGLLALTAGYERQQGAGVNMMLSSPANMAAGEAAGVAARAATVGAKVSTLAKGVEETSQRAATSPETKAEMKASHVSPRSAASATVQSLPQGVAVQGAPVVSIVNGTVNVTEGKVYVDDDTGSIGADGKRQGALADMPNFGFPIAMAVGGMVLFIFTCVYMSYCVKPEKRREPKEKSRREKEASGGSPDREF